MSSTRPLSRIARIVGIAVLIAAVSVPVSAQALSPSVGPPSRLVLSSGAKATYSQYGSLMNGVSHQEDAILTVNGWQYATFWGAEGRINVSRRELPSGQWQNMILSDYQTTTTDSHNVIAMGVSEADGRIHLAFDHHVSELNYRVSAAGVTTNPSAVAWTASLFGPVKNRLYGTTAQTSVTYPQFIPAPNGSLQLTWRRGTSGSGNQLLFDYRDGAWSSRGTIINGNTTNVNAYLFGTEYDVNGRLHTTWVWRETTNASTNRDLMYAYSDDEGMTWRNNAGNVVAVAGSSAITQNTAGVKVATIPMNRGLINQEAQVVDNEGNVHVLTSQLPASSADIADFATARQSTVQVHYWRDAATGAWTKFETEFRVDRRGDIVADSVGNLYLVSTGLSDRLNVYTASAASGWTDWRQVYRYLDHYYDSDPLIDHELIKSQNRLSVFAAQGSNGVIDVLDWQLTQ